VHPRDIGTILVSVTLDGSPADGVAVKVLNDAGQLVDLFGSSTSSGTNTGVTGADGKLTLVGDPLKTFTVTIVSPAGANCTPTLHTVIVTKDQTVSASFTCERPATINVLVTTGGAPLSAANVTLTGAGVTRNGTTGLGGTVTFTDLKMGQYVSDVTVDKHTCAPQSTTVVPGQTASLSVPCVPKPGSVTGQVTVNGIGEPGVQVRLVQGPTTVAMMLTNGGGTYVFSSVVPGPYDVVITTPDLGASCALTTLAALVHPDETLVRNFACTRPTFPTGPEIAGNNWVYTRNRTSAIGPNCQASLPTSGAGTMSFDLIAVTILITGFDPQVAILGTYLLVTGTYIGTGTRTLGGGTSLTTHANGIFLRDASARPTFSGKMLRVRVTGTGEDCREEYDIVGTRL
jgi:hypothetical protein